MNQELIDKYRDINVEYHGWWEDVESMFHDDMAEKHVVVQDIQFSGFGNQGDGASFTGRIHNVEAFLAAHELTETYPTIVRYLKSGGDICIPILRTGRSIYFHANSMVAEVDDYYSFEQLLPPSAGHSDVRVLVAEQWDKMLTTELTTLEAAITEIVRGYGCELYRRLEAEYDYLASDEVVWDTIIANELEKENQ